jgi:glycosyltransferase involved in cell wall biosynthesis
MLGHTHALLEAGYPVTVIAGRGEASALPPGADFVHISLLDTQHPEIDGMAPRLDNGQLPPDFDQAARRLVEALEREVTRFDTLIVHNVFTKHFNLPLTAALFNLLDARKAPHCIAWCHDFTWTSPGSRSRVFPGYPWDLLRTYRPDVTYVVVSAERQRDLAALLNRPPEEMHVVYNGVDPGSLLGLSAEGEALVNRLGLLERDLILLMPVRVTQAKNIEYALRVVAALKGRGSRACLVVTGPPDPHDANSMAYYRSLQELRRQLDVEREARFVLESGPNPDEPFTIGERVVGDLYRVSDVMFMPSHREGFGMPVLEAGVIGLPVVASTAVPAAGEIAGADAVIFDLSEEPDELAERLLAWAEKDAQHSLRRRTRQRYTWKAIFEYDIHPLLIDKEQP